MADPITLAVLMKLAVGIGGKIAVKAYFLGKMAGLKALLTSWVGPQAATISTGLLATAFTAAFWEMKVKRNSDDDAVQAAVAKGVTEDVARGIVRYISGL